MIRIEACLRVVVGLSLLCLGVHATRPTKTINQADDGNNCEHIFLFSAFRAHFSYKKGGEVSSLEH